jgi:hypothetical protein
MHRFCQETDMPAAAPYKLLSTRLRDPQSWVSLIAASTLIGLCAGVFEPADTSTATDNTVAEPQQVTMAQAR